MTERILQSRLGIGRKGRRSAREALGVLENFLISTHTFIICERNKRWERMNELKALSL